MQEEWRDVPGYEGKYRVSDKGNVEGCRNGMWHMLKPYVKEKRRGYLIVHLHKDGKSKYYRLHRLVWEAFNGPIPEGMHVNHMNEKVEDCRLENLNLLTPKENNAWGTHTQRSVETREKRKRVLQYDLEGNLLREWNSPVDVERNTGYNRSNIASCCCRRKHYNTAYGFIWRYKK